MTTRTQRPTLNDLFRWGYQSDNRSISFITNVIQISGCHRKAKMQGLYNLTAAGNEVSTGNDLFSVRINGVHHDMTELEKHA